MGKKSIDEFSNLYGIYKFFIRLFLRIYYKKIFINNASRVPLNRPLIFAVNHQNALMDALALLSFIEYQPVFLARQDIFKGKTIIRILNFLKIMPVYRIRDGRSNLAKNDEIFDATLQVLRKKINPMAIMPEGNHGDKRHLRPLVKGIFRIAFQGQDDYGAEKGIVIVPVGLDWGHYWNFRSSFLLNFGEPIEVAEYYNQYIENPAIATNELRDRLSAEISKVMIDIQSEQFYTMVQELRTIYNPSMSQLLKLKGKNLLEKFIADKEMIKRLGDFEKGGNLQVLVELNEKVAKYNKSLNELSLRDWVVRKKGGSFIGILLKTVAAVVTFPLYLVGALTNYIPYKIPEIITKKIKDKQFLSSFKFALGIVTFLLWYIFLTVVILIVTNFSLPGLLFIISMPFTGLFAFDYYIFLKKNVACWKFKLMMWFNYKKIIQLVGLRDKIVNITDSIIKK